MKRAFLGRFVLGLAALSIAGLGAAYLGAQPPLGKAKGPRPRPGNAQSATVRGTVREFTTAPKGEVDGLMLTDDTWVHWPPHLQDRFKDIAARGDQVRAAGYWETGPAGDTKLEVSTLTNLRNDATAENPDFANGPPLGARAPRRPGPERTVDREQRLKNLEDRIEELQREIEHVRRER